MASPATLGSTSSPARWGRPIRRAGLLLLVVVASLAGVAAPARRAVGLPIAITAATGSTAPGLAAGSAPIGRADYLPPRGAFYVSKHGNNAHSGSLLSPWRTIRKAVKAAPSGSTIVVRGGTYHESVIFPHGKRLTLENYPHEAVWLDGAVRVDHWTRTSAGWRHNHWTARFNSTDPTAKDPDPYSRMVNKRHPMAAHPDMVFVDGRSLKQVASRKQLKRGAFYVNYKRRQLWMGSNPTGHVVEASTLAEAVYVNGGAGSVLRGFGVRHYATPLVRYGAVKAFANRMTVEDLVITANATRGLNVQGADVHVRHVTSTDNGLLGLGAYRSDHLTVDACQIAGNNTEHFNEAPEAGGAKVSQSAGLNFTANQVSGNIGNGVWTDLGSARVTFSGNNITDNTGHGVDAELTGYGSITGDAISDNRQAGIYLPDSNNITVSRNDVDDNAVDLDVIDGPRVLAAKKGETATGVVAGIRIFDNLFRAGRLTTSFLTVDDATHRRKAARLATADRDVYEGAPGRYAFVWSNYGAKPPTIVAATLKAFRKKTGKEQHGTTAG